MRLKKRQNLKRCKGYGAEVDNSGDPISPCDCPPFPLPTYLQGILYIFDMVSLNYNLVLIKLF